MTPQRNRFCYQHPRSGDHHVTIYLAVLATIATVALLGIYSALDRAATAAERQARMWEVK